MRASRALVAALTITTAILAAPAAEARARGGGDLPSRIGLPAGWQPEGITSNRTTLFVGSLRNGALWKADPRTGRGEVLAPGRQGQVAVGVTYDRRRNLIWVAGGETGVVRAHDAGSGRVVARYRFGGTGFLNDLTVTPGGVYATDSLGGALAVVPLSRRRDSLPEPGRARLLPLHGDFEPVVDQFNLNGIVRAGRWLLAVQSVNGRLFRIDPRTGATRRVDVGDARLRNGDGLERRGEILYVVRNRYNKVVALDLGPRLTAASWVTALRSPGLDVPSTAAVALGALWAVNARFGTQPTPETRYWITRLPVVSPPG